MDHIIRINNVLGEFSAFSSIRNATNKIVMSFDKFDFSRDDIKHINIEQFLLGQSL